MLIDGIETWAPKLPVKNALVQFSSPEIVMEMHANHLRSAIIGDTLARMLEFSDVAVTRRNHLGDSGAEVFLSFYNYRILHLCFLFYFVIKSDFNLLLQIGMLIQHLFEKVPNWNSVFSSQFKSSQDIEVISVLCNFSIILQCKPLLLDCPHYRHCIRNQKKDLTMIQISRRGLRRLSAVLG